MLLNWECCKVQERERNGTTGTNEVQLCGWIKPREQNHPRKSSKQFKTMPYLCTYAHLCIFLLHYLSLNTQNIMGEKKARTGHNDLRYLMFPLWFGLGIGVYQIKSSLFLFIKWRDCVKFMSPPVFKSTWINIWVTVFMASTVWDM